jgi:[ribosomal protein S5]-alanine N-acetyltransferase
MVKTNFALFPVLQTERLVLRKLNAIDAPAIFQLRSDKRVNAFLDRPILGDIEGAHQFIAKIENLIAAKESLYWAITIKGNDTLIGTICIWNIEKQKAKAEMGYELLSDFQGKGLMQEAIEKIIEFAFSEMKLSVITALTKAENHPSVKVLLKNSFQLDSGYEFVSKEAAEELDVYYLLSSASCTGHSSI